MIDIKENPKKPKEDEPKEDESDGFKIGDVNETESQKQASRGKP